MAFQFSDAALDGALDAVEAATGASPLLRLFTGTAPATCADASTGTQLAEMALPADWMAAASGGSKAKSGTWQDTSADAAGTAGYFRIFNSAGTVCHIQGSVGQGTGDLDLDNATLEVGQEVVINTFVLNAGT